MKVRESGMPDEEFWASFFNPEFVLRQLGLTETVTDVAELGCGYGTFTLPAARLVTGRVHAFDIEPEMISITREKAEASNLSNLEYYVRDFVAGGTTLPEESVDYVMLFNILHAARPLLLLEEANRILTPAGKIGVMHWNHDPTTPRGPSMEIRPTPEQCQAWARESGFELVGSLVDLPPYHYGFVAAKA